MLLAGGLLLAAGFAPAQQTAPAGQVPRVIGTVKALNGNTITVAPDSGPNVDVIVQDSTRMVRTAPGQKDLKDAVPTTLAEIQAGDRMLAKGKLAEDGKSIVAVSIVVMKQAEITSRQKQEQEEWQKHGVGGLVDSVDAAAGVVAISSRAGGTVKKTAVLVSPKTVIRRYAPDSVKFDNAKPGTLAEIKPGDQLRARGKRSADSDDFAAEEIVSGAFRNISGLIIAVDPAQYTITVKDLLSKQPVTVRISADSQLKQLPQMVARFIAMRLKGATPEAGAGNQGLSAGSQGPGGRGPEAGAANQASAAKGQEAGPRAAGGPPGNGNGGHGRSPADLQQMLNHLPDVALKDLQKNDAVMIVATEGSASSAPAAITLLTGVEPILTASPKGEGMQLSPWNLNSSISDAMGQ
jgi:hypothetical protein